jgi:hypothetical protein
MMKKRKNSRTAHTALFVSLVAFFIAMSPVRAVAAPAMGAGQRSTTPKERVIDGKVVDKGDTALAGSVVYLKDTRSLSVKTFICDEAGHFHFGHLSQNTDYELWADSKGVKSNTKSISSFDDKNSYYFTLTVK